MFPWIRDLTKGAGLAVAKLVTVPLALDYTTDAEKRPFLLFSVCINDLLSDSHQQVILVMMVDETIEKESSK